MHYALAFVEPQAYRAMSCEPLFLPLKEFGKFEAVPNACLHRERDSWDW